MSGTTSLWRGPTAIAFAVIFALGCKVGSDDVAWWKGTVKGPGKLVALIKSDRYTAELKTEAALSMVEMERADVSGLSMLAETLEQLKLEGAEELTTIADGMVPRLKTLMTSGEQTGAPSPQQVRAKDASYVVIPYASGAAKKELTKALIGWYAKDFPNRSLTGDYSAEQVTEGLGAPAATMLVDALDAKMPEQALIKIAEIISQHGDSGAKSAAATKLVAIEKEIESPGYVKWMEQVIAQQYAKEAQKPEASRIRTVALFNRERRVNFGALPAMKYLGDQKVVRDRLVQIASTKPAAGDPAAWAERLNERRARALQALEGHVSRTELKQLLRVALDGGNPDNVRDNAFDRVGDIGSPQAIPSLWPLVSSGGGDGGRLRWRAGEMVLAIGGPSIVSTFLQRLPAGAAFEPGELTGYATRMSQMSPPPVSLMRSQLSARNWWARVLALRFLERKGTKADIAKVAALRSDSAKTVGKGWKTTPTEGDTVGKVAKSALAALKARLAEPKK